MKKKLVMLSIIGLMSIGAIAYATDKTITPNIEQSNIYLDEARALTRKNDLTGAEKKLNEALKLDNKNAEVYYELGQIEIVKKNAYKAISYFTKAIEINPNNDDYYVGRANAENIKFNLKAMLDDLNKVLELNPANGRAYMIIGATYMNFGYPEEAIKYFDKAAEHEEIMRDWLYPMRADAKKSLRDYDGAIADLEKAIEVVKKGDNLNKVRNIEYIKNRINELKEAKKVFK